MVWWNNPLSNMDFVGVTSDSMSFQSIDIKEEVELPIGDHVGAFGVSRKHDRHKGVDLYAPDGTIVGTIERGTILMVRPWTGEKAGYPWWNETEALLVQGKSGIIAYGEIEAFENLTPGTVIPEGHPIGIVKRVLKEDKGRPTSMLHLQMYREEPAKVGPWELGTKKPWNLIDPTPYLLTWGLLDLFIYKGELIKDQAILNDELSDVQKRMERMVELLRKGETIPCVS